MQDASLFYTNNSPDMMVKAFADMQMNYLAQSYYAPSMIELDLVKEYGEYRASLSFTSTDFTFLVSSRSWSPYKAIELATVQARDEIIQRFYNACSYV